MRRGVTGGHCGTTVRRGVTGGCCGTTVRRGVTGGHRGTTGRRGVRITVIMYTLSLAHWLMGSRTVV